MQSQFMSQAKGSATHRTESGPESLIAISLVPEIDRPSPEGTSFDTPSL